MYNSHFPETEITIRHLATHTSSIIDSDFYDNNSYFLANQNHLETDVPIKVFDYFNPPTSKVPIADFMKTMLYKDDDTCCRETFSDTKPGTTYKYSNGGNTLAAVVLEAATRTSFVHFTQKYILTPLNMSSTSWNPEDIEATLYHDGDTVYADYLNRDYPAGALVTNAEDLSKYLQELIKGYNGKGTLLSDEKYISLFNKPFVEQLSKEKFAQGQNLLTQIQ